MIKVTSLMLTVLCVLAWTLSGSAEDGLTFPKTESDFVKALSIKDGETTIAGVKYVCEKGVVYKIIRDKRYKMRGLEGIVESKLVPKAGALIHFDFGSATIKKESYPLLDEFARALKGGLAGVPVMVGGHTDNMGSVDFNLGLSERRARAVKAYFENQHQISPNRLIVKGYGKEQPIASNDSEDGRTLNRRVEFVRTGVQ